MSSENISASTTLQPGQDIKPKVTQEQAILVTERLYGIKVKGVKELNSYDDKNYLITLDYVTEDSKIQNDLSKKYVIKVLNSMDSQKTHVDAEHEVSRLLNKAGYLCPLPVKTCANQEKSLEFFPNDSSEAGATGSGSHHLVRLLSFIEGLTFFQVPYEPSLLYQAGKYIGGIEKTLQNYSHESLNNHQTLWSLASVPRLKEFIHAVKDEKHHSLISSIVQSFQENVLTVEEHFDKGIIHGDYNEQNIIVKEKKEGCQHEIIGVIDFGDLHRSCYVYEVAITIMYMMVESKIVDVMEVGGHVLAGYLSERSLSPEEWSVLHTCVAARYAQSLTLGAYSYMLDSSNDYVIVTAKRGWPQLEAFWSTPAEQIYEKWRKVMDNYATLSETKD